MQFDRVLLTVEESVLLTGVARATLYRAIKAGDLPSRSIAGRRRILRGDLERFIGLPLGSA